VAVVLLLAVEHGELGVGVAEAVVGVEVAGGGPHWIAAQVRLVSLILNF